MLYIDRKNKDGKRLRYYFGNTSTYRAALSENGSDIKVMQLADSIVDTSSNKVIKSRNMIQEVFDKFYENQAFENSIIRE